VLELRSPRIFAFLAGVALAVEAGTAGASKPGPRPLWSFHAGAPLSGPPGVGPDGSLVVGTLDGYVHALRPDGVFRYSYTLDGRVVGSPVVLGDGVVLAASDKRRLYAIRPDGSLAWATTVFGGVLPPLAVDAQDRVWLRTGSGTAVAYSRRGGVVGFAKIGRAATLGPVVSGTRGVLVASPAGELGLIGDFGKFRRTTIPQTLTNVWSYERGFLAFGERKLSELDAELAVGWSRPDVDALLCATPVVTREAGEIRWLAEDGGVRARVASPLGATEPSACTGASLFAVDARGAIVHVRSNGDVVRLDSPAGALVGLAPTRPGSLVAAYQDGRVVALKAAF